MPTLLSRSHLSWLMLAVSVAGCGKEAGPPLASVRGKITIDGKIVAGAGIQMIAEGPQGSVAYGSTDKDGNYEMAFGATRTGAIVGRNRVILNSDSRVSIGGEKYDGAEVFPPEYNVKSEKYVEVKDGKNTFDFDVAWGEFKPKKPPKSAGGAG